MKSQIPILLEHRYKPKIYLAGPINNMSDEDCQTWRRNFATCSDLIECLDPMGSDYRGRELKHYKEIVEGDLVLLGQADAIVVWFTRPSAGTAMEIFHASTDLKIPVLVVDWTSASISPWVSYYATKVVKGRELIKPYTFSVNWLIEKTSETG